MVEQMLPPSLPEELPPKSVVGITATVPVEVIYAAGLVPVDLNNLFVTGEHPLELAERAERAGFPRACCCWTKGLYGAVHEFGIARVIGVTRGDCSNAEALLAVLQHEGVDCMTFNYPQRQEAAEVAGAIAQLAEGLSVALPEAEGWRERLAPARAAAAEIDRLSWEEGKLTGLENHLWLVSASDFCADPERYEAEARAFVAAAAERAPAPDGLRLGLCGIPPIVPHIYEFLESMGARVVYNETQRQFAMLEPAGSLAEQYARYTYPYGVFARIEDIRAECARRRLDGLIHYVQSFCHRRIEDRIIRDRLSVPVLTLEADRPEPLSGQLKTRLETFVQMLRASRRRTPG
ncbi:MAG: 2-hydroxyacyl-CoA dehydratase family protein [Planctomycetota bacterium]|jgi:benzoyl-CoA reductase/2-hydroxyglutaryl-CoA dehydratase subunit BcrC/BadD/HgdB